MMHHVFLVLKWLNITLVIILMVQFGVIFMVDAVINVVVSLMVWVVDDRGGVVDIMVSMHNPVVLILVISLVMH